MSNSEVSEGHGWVSHNPLAPGMRRAWGVRERSRIVVATSWFSTVYNVTGEPY